LLNVADPHVEFFQSQLKPWVHYVPVARDFSDLNSRLQWLGDHQAEAQKIGEAGRDWALQQLQPPNLVRTTDYTWPQLLRAVAHVIF
jgi:protein glucosyltransferase